MNRLHLLLLVALPLCPADAWSQETDALSSSEIPSGPLLQAPPAFSQWIVTFSYPDDQKQKGADNAADAAKPMPANLAVRPRTITTTKTGDIIHEETVSVVGIRTEDWQVNGDYYIKYAGKTIWSAYEKSAPAPIINGSPVVLGLATNGFRGLDWINKETYAGKMKTSYGDCLIFVPGGRNSTSALDPGKIDSLPKIACIDAATRLPTMARAAGETRVFTFTQPPPTALQTLPDDLAAEIKTGNQLRAKRQAAPETEY